MQEYHLTSKHVLKRQTSSFFFSFLHVSMKIYDLQRVKGSIIRMFILIVQV
jgi:hypothetical protein